jgi:hypothetical protein
MHDLALNFPKKRNFTRNTSHILESLIQEGFLTLSVLSQSSSAKEADLEVPSEENLQRVENLLKKNSVLPENLNLSSLSNYLFKAFKNSSFTAHQLALSLNHLKGFPENLVTKGLVLIIWSCLKTSFKDEKKAESRIASWIRKINKRSIARSQFHVIFNEMLLENAEKEEMREKSKRVEGCCRNLAVKDSLGLENYQNSLRLAGTGDVDRQPEYFSPSFKGLLPLNFKDQDTLGIFDFSNQDFLDIELEELFFVNN